MALNILEGSDTRLKFHITEIEDGVENAVDLTDYDKVVLVLKYYNEIVEVEGTVCIEDTSYVTFDLLSEQTAGRAGKVQAEIWGIAEAKKVRFNSFTIDGDVLHSIKIPEWVVNADN